MLHINIDDLRFVPAISQAQHHDALVSLVEFGSGEPPIEIYRVPDVLYLPNLLQEGQSLQIVDRKIVPLEAVLYEYIAEFVKHRVEPTRRQLLSTGFEVQEIERDVCILANVFSRNFTHWHEELMKLLLLEKAGLRCTYVFADLPPFARASLELIGIDAQRILNIPTATMFRSALFTTPPINYYNLTVHPEAFYLLREAFFVDRHCYGTGRQHTLMVSP